MYEPCIKAGRMSRKAIFGVSLPFPCLPSPAYTPSRDLTPRSHVGGTYLYPVPDVRRSERESPSSFACACCYSLLPARLVFSYKVQDVKPLSIDSKDYVDPAMRSVSRVPVKSSFRGLSQHRNRVGRVWKDGAVSGAVVRSGRRRGDLTLTLLTLTLTNASCASIDLQSFATITRNVDTHQRRLAKSPLTRLQD